MTSDSDEVEIKDSEMKDALLRSGYLLEFRAEDFFRQHQMIAEANAAYLDPETQKSREIDLLVRNAEGIHHGEKRIGTVGARIIFECKNNPQPLCFFLKARGAFSYGEIIKGVSNPVHLGDCKIFCVKE